MRTAISHLCLMTVLLEARAGEPLPANVRVPGVVEGFSGLKTDKILDGALVLPSLRDDKILEMDLKAFLFPSETMKAGPLNPKVPGNLYFPTQRENYGLLPVTVEKLSFTYFSEVPRQDELSAFWFSVSWDKLTDAAQDPLKLKEALRDLRIKRHSFESDRDWSQSRKITLSLNQSGIAGQSYQWQKSQGSNNEIDLGLSLQSTPANRWALVDVQSPASSGRFVKLASLGSEFRHLFGRITLTKDGKSLESARFFIREGQETPLNLQGLPTAPEARIVAKTVEWGEQNSPGWVRILIQSQKSAQSPMEPWSLALSLGLESLWRITNSVKSPWIMASVGHYSLPESTTPEDSVTFLRVDTAESGPVESALRDAQSLRARRLKSTN